MIKKNDQYIVNREDLPLMQMTGTFVASSIWLAKGMDKLITTFDLCIRDFNHRNYMLFCGTEEIIAYLKSLKFSDADIGYLLKLKLITKECAQYLKKFKFSGTVYALPEGTPFFPGEPMVRITAPIIEASLIEVVLMGIASSNIPFLTKAVRAVQATQGKFLLSTGPLRAHSFESGMKASRAAYIAGMAITVSPIVAKKYKINVSNPVFTGQHFFIKSFGSEIEAMETMAEFFPNSAAFMVDTYDIKQGIENAIRVAKQSEKKNQKLFAVFIDSGDIAFWCKYTRQELDKHGLKYVKIFTGTNMDEYKIAGLVRGNVPCDIVALATEYMTLSDSPKVEVVYKVAEIRDKEKISFVAKLSPGKLSLPGKKQIFRIYSQNGKYRKDIIGLDDEKLGEPLLKKVMEGGKIIYSFPSLDEIKAYTNLQLKKLPAKVLDIQNEHLYKVEISGSIKKLLNQLRKQHVKK